jgi:hypothetical protein
MKSLLVLVLLSSCVNNNSCNLMPIHSDETYTEKAEVLETHFTPATGSEGGAVAIGGGNAGGMPALPGAGVMPILGSNRTPETYTVLLRLESGTIVKSDNYQHYGQCKNMKTVVITYRKVYASDCSAEIGTEIINMEAGR